MRWTILFFVCGCAGAPAPTPRAASPATPRATPVTPAAPVAAPPATPATEVAAPPEPVASSEPPPPDAGPSIGDEPRGPRVVHGRRGYATMSDGTEHPPPPEVPPGYVRYEPAELSTRLAGPVWLARRPGHAEEAGCDRWVLRRTRDGMVRERRYRERFGSGRAEMREWQPLHGGPLVFQAFCLGYQRRWIRRPGPTDGLPGLRGACGAVWPMTIVGVDDERITWIEAANVFAYDPAVVKTWFRTEAACEAALEPEL